MPRIGVAVRTPLELVVGRAGPRYCPVRESRLLRFSPGGTPRRENVRCPVCHDRARRRNDWEFMTRHPDLLDGRPKRMLHVAPEPGMSRRLARVPRLDDLTADRPSPDVMVRMDITDITDIRSPDDSFDVIDGSPVLEHVPDDRRAMSEFLRVLGRGWPLLQVPIAGDLTWGDASITEPAERERHVGRSDHVRICGPDDIERMAEAGFETRSLSAADVLSDERRTRIGVTPDEGVVTGTI